MRSWSFKSKVLLASLILVAVSLMIAATALVGLNRFEKSFESFNNSNNLVALFYRIKTATQEIRQLEAEAVLEPSTEPLSAYPKRMSDLYKIIDNSLTIIDSSINDDEKKKQVDELRKNITKRREISEKVIKSSIEGDSETAFSFLPQSDEIAKSSEEKIEKFVDGLLNEELTHLGSVKKDFSIQGRTWIYWVSFVSLVGIVFGVLLNQALFMATVRGLRRASESISDSAGQFLESTQQCSETTTHLCKTTASHADTLEKVASTVESLANAVGESASHAQATVDAAAEHVEQSARAEKASEHVVAAIDEINRTNSRVLEHIDYTQRNIVSVFETIREVHQCTKAINEIAFQTKLLSFNASVEAARAGESGKGFAIVAEEISNISQLSARTSQDIGTLVTGSSQKLESLVNDMQQRVDLLVSEGREKIESGTRKAIDYASISKEIAKSANALQQVAMGICHQMKDQGSGLTEINAAMVQLTEMMKQNSIQLGECSTSADSLAQQSEKFHSVVRHLTTVLNGNPGLVKRPRLQREEESRSGDSMEFEIGTESPVQPKLRAVQSKSESKGKRSKVQSQRKSGEEILRKAAGAEDIPLETDKRANHF